jgi:predicted DNA-binding transcriptional regulator YafY
MEVLILAGNCNTKLKLLCLYTILEELTDEDHPITVNEIITELAKHGITAERKSIYSDIKLLEEYGMDICRVTHSRKHGYFLANRLFEVSELKLLIDAIQSARFITRKKTRELIKKFESLTSKNLSKNLHKHVFVNNRLKYDNEEIFYNIDKLHRAISNNKKISFKYYSYNIDKKRVMKRNGLSYIVNPYAMTWYDDNYYLIGNMDKWDDLAHFRVDRICGLEVLDECAKSFEKVSLYKNIFNTADYSKKIYYMFSGEVEKVRIRFSNGAINSVLDRFGMDTSVMKDGDEYFIVTAEIVPSDGFISWLYIFGEDAEVLSPESLREKVKHNINSIKRVYDI